MRVAIRSSSLSQKQFEELQGLLPDQSFTPVLFQSLGDGDHTTSLLDGSAPEDFFTRELDAAVLTGAADIGLHSAKDLPWPLPRGLEVYALTPRKSPDDDLVSKANWTLETLPGKSRIGCSSPTRSAELRRLRPDVEIVSIRGTIHERMAYLDDQRVDAVVVAACALERLGLPRGQVLPWAAHDLQGYLAVVGPIGRPKLRAQFETLDVRKAWGFVSIAGAGPGRKELITLKSWDLLKAADVVYYDALLDQSILAEVPGETVFVGKRQKQHEKSQDEINRLLWESAMAGKQVVRLKGGDPLVFGRGSEEAEYLGRRLIDYEIVPGVSAAQAAAAYAEIPLTERGRASSISLLRGYPNDSAHVTDADMHVVYMPRMAVKELAEQWQARDPEAKTRAAWVHGAASDGQAVSLSTAAEIQATMPPDQEAPLLLVAGTTVDDRAGNGWFDRQSRIWYTGSDPVRIPKRVRFTHWPLIRFEDASWPDLGDTALDPQKGAYGDRYGAVIFTSRHTVRAVFARLMEKKTDARAFYGTQVISIGEATTKELRAHGLRPDIQATDDSSKGIVQIFRTIEGATQRSSLHVKKAVLLPCSDRARPTIREGLSGLGYRVDVVEVYRTLPPLEKPPLDPEFFDEIVFTSPSTVENFFSFFPRVPTRPILRVRGEETASALERAMAPLGASERVEP